MKKLLSMLSIAVLLSSCAIVRPGEVGVRSSFGVLGKTSSGGIMMLNPFTTKVIKVPIKTVNRELLISLPSKEGLTIQSEISILYRVKPDMAKQVIETIGLNFDKIITAVFRSASADVSSRFFAKDMHSGQRAVMEKEIAEQMNALLNEKGFVIEAVLLKSIQLPERLSRAIEQKLQAEQDAQRMEFVLISEQKEAERKKIEAKGTRDAQLILSEGLTDKILELRKIEMLQKLSASPNAKVIVTGENPSGMIIGQ